MTGYQRTLTHTYAQI